MELIQSLLNYYKNLHVKVQNLSATRLARRLVFAWMFVNYFILATKGSFFYSDSAMIAKKNFAEMSLFDQVFNLLHYDQLTPYYPVFLILILISSGLSFFEVLPRTTAALSYFLMSNLDNKAYVILDGGNNLMHLIAFYLIFVNPKKVQSTFSTTLTNLGVLMIKIQVTLVYATAGLLKVMGPLWNKGVALYYTMGVPEYGNDHIFQALSQYSWMLALFTLGTVLFQISLPYLIWIKQWRPLVILIGTALHLSISFVMGLFMFGLAMCVSYFFFHEDATKEVV